jgi:uracil-DNA glycosylase family 4
VQDIYNKWKSCTACGLCKKRTQVVFGDGNYTDPKILVIGEAPGPQEDASGIPFYGPTGKLLRRTMESVGINPTLDCFITNSVLCFPTINGKDFRGPTGEEIRACLPRLDEQFNKIANTVKVVLLTGKRALVTWLYREALLAGNYDHEYAWNALKIEKHLGWVGDTTPQTYVIYHPSYISRLGANIASLPFIQWKKDLQAVADFALHGQMTRPRG